MTDIDSLDDPKALQQLSSQLSHINAGVKIAALRRSVAFQEKAPRRSILVALLDQREYVRAAAAETVEALKPWITDEQWLESLQEPLFIVYQAALTILETQGPEAPYKPIFRASFALKRSLRTQAQHLLAIQAQQWQPQKVAQFVQKLTEILQKGAPTNRMIALELLEVLGDRAPVEVFLAALQDSEADVRWTALVQLAAHGEQGRELPVEPIAALIKDTNPRIRYRVLYALKTQEKMPVDLFITALQDPDERVRQTAAFYLGKRRDIQAVPALLQFLLYDADGLFWDYCDSAITALSELYEHIPSETLIDALNSSKASVHLQAISLLHILKERTPVKLLLELLEHKSTATRKQALYAVRHHWNHFPIEIMLNKLKDRDKKVRETAARVLSWSKLEIPENLLLPLLDCPENIARTAAVRLLGKRMPMERLLAALHDHKWTVRVAAIEILGTLGEKIPLDVLLEALCDKNLEVCRAALQALGEQGERAPIPIITGALLGSRRISRTAVEVLAKLGKQPPYELLMQALQDPRAHIRRMGIEYLQSLPHDNPPPVDAIMPLLQDSNIYVRRAALQTLAQWGVAESAELFVQALADNDYFVRETALGILGTLGERVPREPLKALLGDARGCMYAIKCLQQTHPEMLREVVEEASRILLGQGTGELLGSIQQAHIAEIIGYMPGPGPLLINKLVELLDWPHPRVRMTAAQALDKHNPLQLEIQA
ncbi:hypothetical protein KSC_007500 [Ktedonobacter sp. SOSP1-52]|uniref:HEAT repeat domain-containing protein n=1 Tax=Ktedonobacter sp. SOSP1-52 TaxID=2778366 RepID=UPI001914E30D|nr:HEAT repeat domain-containing protein [Ktedonobacter sp. SOSP1-52]GHO61858.1 hypothetical protein KSC_007500 [Ktedonobacter sp. SOSP1-52]